MLLYILLYKQSTSLVINFVKLVIYKYKTFIKFNLHPVNTMRFISKTTIEPSLAIPDSFSQNKFFLKTGYLLDYNIKFLISKISLLKDDIFTYIAKTNIYFLISCVYLNFFTFTNNYKLLNTNS